MTSQFVRLVVRPQQDVARLIDGVLSYGRRPHGEVESRSAELIMHPATTWTNGYNGADRAAVR